MGKAVSLKLDLRAEQVPEWLRFPYIHSGYRLGGDYLSCSRSFFYLHNEAVNAWTMCCGLIVSTWLVISFLAEHGPMMTALQVSAFVAFWLSYSLHCPWSVAYHTFLPISPTVANQWRRLDMSFIMAMAVLLTWSLNAMAFGLLVAVPLTCVDAACAALAIQRISRISEGTSLDRGPLITLIGLVALGYHFPIFFCAIRDLVLLGKWTSSVTAMLGVPGSLALGAAVYATHFPEHFFPGKLDLWGNSHQIMHVGVVSAHLFGFHFIQGLYK